MSPLIASLTYRGYVVYDAVSYGLVERRRAAGCVQNVAWT